MNVRRALHRIIDDLRCDGRGPILVFVASGWFLSVGSRLVFPAILPEFRTTFSLDLATAGLLLTILWTSYALGQLPGGLLADYIGERNTLAISTFGAGLTLGLVVLAVNRLMLFAVVSIFGFATAIYGTTRITVLGDVYSDRSGTAIGLTSAVGNIGNSVLPLLGGLLAAMISWRISLGIVIPVFVFVGGGLWWFVPNRTSQPATGLDFSINTVQRIGVAIRDPTVAPITVLITLAFFIWQGFTGFYPTYLVDIKGLESGTAASLYGLFFALGVVIEPAAGVAQDRFGTRPTLTVAFVIQSFCLVLLQMATGFVSLLLVTVVLSSILAPTTVVFTHLSEALPNSIQGTALGLIRTVYMLIGATSPWLVGSLADQGLFTEAFWLLALLALLATGLCFFVREV